MAYANALALFTSVIFSLQLLLLVAGAPLPDDGRWVNPCGGSTPVSGTSFIPPATPAPPPISTDLQSLKLMSQTAVSLSDEISYTIKPRIGNSVAEALDSYDSFPGIPSTSSSFTTGITIENLLQMEVERVSKIGVFLEQALEDTHDYTDKIEQQENKYAEILCKMHVILQQHNQEVTTSISRDIMGDDLRNLHETSQIDQRNYLINRDAKKVFVTISEAVDAYIAENNL